LQRQEEIAEFHCDIVTMDQDQLQPLGEKKTWTHSTFEHVVEKHMHHELD